jgi:hypothetical protein
MRYTAVMTAIAGQSGTRPADLVARGIAREGFTIGWNVLEAALAIGTGIVARSIALTGFGADSVIEVIAAVALFLRLRAEARGGGASRERAAIRVVAITFFLLSAYVVVDAGGLSSRGMRQNRASLACSLRSLPSW